MIKKSLLALTCTGFLAACDVPNLTSSGGDSAPTLASAEAPADEAKTPETIEITEIAQTPKPEEKPAVEAKPPSPPPPPPPPPAPVASKECGVGHYAFRTDSDNKFHFDAHFKSGGVISYNFSVQPNRGKWSISGNTMTFNGPFAAGHSNHVSHWTITARAGDCKVLEFRGKSYGQADVTASRL